MTSDFNPGGFTILGFEGTVPGREFISLVEKFPPAGFLLLGDNYESPEQLARLIDRLKKIVGGTVLIAVDQEPGRVCRFKNGFPASYHPSRYVEGKLEDEFRSWCAETASLLAETGVNLNLAPVLDLAAFSYHNPVLTDRVFGDDPVTVSTFARILVEEHKKRGVLTCGKHFPGLGSASFDPHEKLSLSFESFNRFENHHWKPFFSTAKQNVELIMTTHLLAEGIDPVNVATYSTKTIKYLREKIGFSGPIISDDLIMGGAGAEDQIGGASRKSILSGHNLLIISRGTEQQARVLDSLKNNYARDRFFGKIADQNEEIIGRFKDRILF